jgi:predicted enzyme related to lactoylglutathione lyase
MNFKISQITIAVTDMDAMVKFYENVFGIKLKSFDAYGSTLYSGKMGEIVLMLCPKEIAGVTAKQTRHQFDYIINDVDSVVKAAQDSAGSLMGDVEVSESSKAASVTDPDGNSMVFIQLLK